MNNPKPIFIADTCIGGLSVVKSMWDSGHASNALFMADYEVNPLGVKNESAIADTVNKWFSLAKEHSNTMIIACNTLSIRYHQLPASRVASSGLKQIVSMVDCFEAMIKIEADQLANRKVLLIGTEFTASQSLYPDMLDTALPGLQVNTVAATELERKIARFEPWDSEGKSVFTSELRLAVENSDIAVLACTCFPMAKAELESQFPGVVFIDPGAYCSGLLEEDTSRQEKKLSVIIKGDVVSRARVTEFAQTYLGSDFTGM
jgi:glutamate racemase